jgi:hypothetical protein
MVVVMARLLSKKWQETSLRFRTRLVVRPADGSAVTPTTYAGWSDVIPDDDVRGPIRSLHSEDAGPPDAS